jgi:tetratricopeptide (TPR) repeat protein
MDEPRHRLESLPRRTRQRYAELARRSSVAIAPFAVEWFCNRVLAAEKSPDPQLLARRGEARATQSKWDDAAADLAQAAALPGSAPTPLIHLALLRARAGDAAGARHLLNQLLARFGTLAQNNPSLANNVAWASVRFALELPLELAELAAARGSLGRPDPNSLNTLGAALYRNGRFADAIGALNRAIAAAGGTGTWADWVFLAMAHQRLGHAKEAREWLKKARDWGQSDVIEKPGPSSLDWSSRQEFQLLLTEAAQLMAEATPELPDNPFSHD